MARRYGIHDIPQLPRRPVFFDANVLIYIFWPTGKMGWESDYSSLLRRLLDDKRELVTDAIVLSEVINRALKTEFEKLKLQQALRFKDFRDSNQGKEILSDIYGVVKRSILSRLLISGKIYTQPDLDGFLKVSKMDFNDKLIESVCLDKNFILLTNDRDYSETLLDVLTSNPVLLRS